MVTLRSPTRSCARAENGSRSEGGDCIEVGPPLPRLRAGRRLAGVPASGRGMGCALEYRPRRAACNPRGAVARLSRPGAVLGEVERQRFVWTEFERTRGFRPAFGTVAVSDVGRMRQGPPASRGVRRVLCRLERVTCCNLRCARAACFRQNGRDRPDGVRQGATQTALLDVEWFISDAGCRSETKHGSAGVPRGSGHRPGRAKLSEMGESVRPPNKVASGVPRFGR
jgi:hypothetical protein